MKSLEKINTVIGEFLWLEVIWPDCAISDWLLHILTFGFREGEHGARRARVLFVELI